MSERIAKFSWLRLLRRSQSGSALVEVALTLPALLLMLLGAVELGGLAYRATEMTNAARTAAQYAAMNGGAFTDCNGTFAGGTCSTTSGIYAAAQADAPWAASTCSNWVVTAASSCSCSDSSACTTTDYSCSSGKPVVLVTVTTSASCPGFAAVPKLFSAGSFTLQGSSQQEVLQ